MKPRSAIPGPEPVTVRVDLGGRGYDILVGPELLGRAGALMAPVLRGKRVVAVTDATVAELHLPALQRALDLARIGHASIVLPPGEGTKDFPHLEMLVDRLLEEKVERTTALVALGGGVIGDLVGFAASITLRGLDVVQVPTTLLAQVDSSVGGKTAINARQGKNLVGAFHQPRLVLADTDVLGTLPARERLAGYAEVAKYGAIGDEKFFTWLEGHGRAVVEGEPRAVMRAVAESCAAKARVVAADECEEGERELLNFGHTFGHALEAESGFGDALLHGEAVAAGMALAGRLSACLGLCPVDDAERLARHLAAVGLPTGFAALPQIPWRADRVLEHMTRDKKVRDGRIRLVLLKRLGGAFVSRDVEPGQVLAFLVDEIDG